MGLWHGTSPLGSACVAVSSFTKKKKDGAQQAAGPAGKKAFVRNLLVAVVPGGLGQLWKPFIFLCKNDHIQRLPTPTLPPPA